MFSIQEALHCGDFSTLTVFGLKPRSGTPVLVVVLLLSQCCCFFVLPPLIPPITISFLGNYYDPRKRKVIGYPSFFFPFSVFLWGHILSVLVSLGGVVSLEVEDM